MKDKLKAGGIGSTFPATKGEIKFDGYGDQDYYDISIVDGFNLPVQIELVTGTYKKVGRSDSQYRLHNRGRRGRSQCKGSNRAAPPCV